MTEDGRIRWREVDFVDVQESGALTSDFGAISLTLVQHGDESYLSWGLKARDATLPDIEELLKTVAQGIMDTLSENFDTEWTAGHEDPDVTT